MLNQHGADLFDTAAQLQAGRIIGQGDVHLDTASDFAAAPVTDGVFGQFGIGHEKHGVVKGADRGFVV